MPFSTFSLSAIKFFIFPASLWCVSLFYSLIHSSHSLKSPSRSLSSASPPLHHQSLPVSQALGQEINDGREALAESDFLLSKLHWLGRAVFSLLVVQRWQRESVRYHWTNCVYYTNTHRKTAPVLQWIKNHLQITEMKAINIQHGCWTVKPQDPMRTLILLYK